MQGLQYVLISFLCRISLQQKHVIVEFVFFIPTEVSQSSYAAKNCHFTAAELAFQ